MLVSAYIDENGELNILQRKGLCHALVAGATGCGKSMRYLDSFPIGLSRSCKLIEWMMNNRYISMCGGYYKVLITREEFENPMVTHTMQMTMKPKICILMQKIPSKKNSWSSIFLKMAAMMRVKKTMSIKLLVAFFTQM